MEVATVLAALTRLEIISAWHVLHMQYIKERRRSCGMYLSRAFQSHSDETYTGIDFFRIINAVIVIEATES